MLNNRLLLGLWVVLLFPLVGGFNIPLPVGAVNDFAGMLDSVSKQNIEQLIQEINKKTSVEIVVVTVDSLGGIPKEELAIEFAQKWGVGKKGRDNGILILISRQEREYRIEVGRGLEGVINDAKAGRIGRNVLVPNFQRNQYGKGVYEAVVEIKGFVDNDPEVIAKYSAQVTPLFSYLILFYGVVTFIVTLTGLGKKNVRLTQIIVWDVLTLVAAFFFGFVVPVLFVIFFVSVLSVSIRYGKFAGVGGGFGGRIGGSGFGGFGGGTFGGGGAGGKW